MAELQTEDMSLDTFLRWQEKQQHNYELVDGQPVLTVKAMTGASRRHDYVTINAIAALRRRLAGKPCRPSSDDQSVITSRGTRRPDITVECGAFDPTALTATEPRVVIEVLSPSTMRFDRFQKLAEYQAHPDIQVILLVDSETPSVTLWRREGEVWRSGILDGLDAIIPLPEIDVELPLAELYEDLPFDVEWSQQ